MREQRELRELREEIWTRQGRHGNHFLKISVFTESPGRFYAMLLRLRSVNTQIISVLGSCLLPRRLSVEKSMGAQGKKGTRTRESSPRLFFLPVVPRASRSSPVARASRSSRETPEEEADWDPFVNAASVEKY